MATNRAAQELEALLGASNVPGAANRDLSQEVLADDPRPQYSTDRKAKFSTPEAVATGVAASFILGPVGGILLGAAQGMIGKQQEKRMLEQLAAQNEALAGADEAFEQAFEREQANEDLSGIDRQQLNSIKSTYDVGRSLMLSPYEENQKKGLALMEQALQAKRDFDVRQEEQAIAAQQYEDEARRAMGQENYNRYKDSRDNFMKESAPYLEIQDATVNLLNVLNEDSPAAQYAAIKLLEKALDPRSVVRPEEQEAWGQLGSLMDQVDVIKRRLQSGKSLLPSQVNEIKDVALIIEERAYEMQVEREARYADELDDIFLGDRALTDKYRNNFVLADKLKITKQPGPNNDFSRFSTKEIERWLELNGGQ